VAHATGLFPLLAADQVSANNVLQPPMMVAQTKGFARFSGCSPSGGAKQAGDQAGER